MSDNICQAITTSGCRCKLKASHKDNEDHRYCSRFHQKYCETKTPNKEGTVRDLLIKSPSRSVWSVIVEQNKNDKILFDKLVNGEITKKQYKSSVSERQKGQWQLTMCSYNIREPNSLCKHACSYCYIGPLFSRFGRHCKTIDIEDDMPSNPTSIAHDWSKVTQQELRKIVFFPSSCDVFEENAVDYVSVCKKIIDAGHEVFFTTKPTMKSITAITNEFEKLGPDYKNKLVVFVTITTNNDKILKEFEQFASNFEERIQALKYLVDHGYNTNVFVEPYLSDPIPLMDQLIPIIGKGIIAVGGMNYFKKIKFSNDPTKNDDLTKYLVNLYSPENTKLLYQYTKSHDNVFIKKHTYEDLIKIFDCK